MAEAYIVEAVRTADGRPGGRLARIHPVELAADVLSALVDRSGIAPDAAEDVIMGCVFQAGEQAEQVGRNAVLASRLPQSVPAVSIDRQCGSSQQAIQFAAQAVMSGTQDVAIAAGVESMSRVPMGLSTIAGSGFSPFSARVCERYGVEAFSQFAGAQMIADKYGFGREDLDSYALEGHRRATRTRTDNDFADEIVPVEIVLPDGSWAQYFEDEGVRRDASLAAIGSVRTIEKGGKITAANASQICDGASAVLVMSAQADHGVRPLARIANLTVTGGDPVVMLEEPLFATDKALRRAGLAIEDIDLYEVNEAFASVPLAWLRHVGADPERLNVNGGAIALGHPLGASGTKLMATLGHALRRRGKRFGLQTMCEGGGTANVTIVENLQ